MFPQSDAGFLSKHMYLPDEDYLLLIEQQSETNAAPANINKSQPLREKSSAPARWSRGLRPKPPKPPMPNPAHQRNLELNISPSAAQLPLL